MPIMCGITGRQHNARGPLGRGVQYDIKFWDGNHSRIIGELTPFVHRNAMTHGIPTEYGNYMGATPLNKIGTDGYFTKKPDYSLPAVDKVDDLAKSHDQGYDKLHAAGANSLMNDWATTPLDETALNGWAELISKNKDYTKIIDPVNNKPVTTEEYDAAQNAILLFTYTTLRKKIDISDFINKNYKSEAKKEIGSNYNLFLKKYMDKDENGNWIRKDKMWAQDEDGNWKPNKPKK